MSLTVEARTTCGGRNSNSTQLSYAPVRTDNDWRSQSIASRHAESMSTKFYLKSAVTLRIDFAGLIEREQIKTFENLSRAIENLQARLVEDLEALGWRRSTGYRRRLVTKLGRVISTAVKVKRGRRVFSPIV